LSFIKLGLACRG